MGFTPQEVAEDATAILDGVEVAESAYRNGRPYTIRVRLGDETRQSLETIANTVFNSASGHTATLGSMANITQLPPQNEIRRENLQRMVVVTARLEGTDLGTAVKQVQQRVQAMHLPANVRVEYGGTYQEQQKSFAELLSAVDGVGVGVWRTADGVPQLRRATRDSCIVGTVDRRCCRRSADYRNHVQRIQLYGADHGHRHRRQERHSSARRR